MCNGTQSREVLAGHEVQSGFVSFAARLHWIASVLSSDKRIAEGIASAAINKMEESRNKSGKGISRRAVQTVVEICIRLQADRLCQECRTSEYWEAQIEQRVAAKRLAACSKETLQRVLLQLPVLPRFLFFLRVLEGYSLADVAQLLNVNEAVCKSALAYSIRAVSDALMPYPASRTMNADQQVSQCCV